MSFNDRLDEIRSGFEPAFWVANFTEIFERVAYYGTQAVLAIYLSEQLHFSSVLTGTLLGIAGFVVYALAILAGALADRFGFRRTLMCAYLVLTAGYFLLGSLETSWMEPLRHAVGDTWLVSLVLLGDLVSLYLAVLGEVDPGPVEVLDRLKLALASG